MSSSDTIVLTKNAILAERFEFLSTLGEGSAGAVFHVKDRSKGGQELALKLLTNPKAFDEHTTERFRQEIAIAQKLRHPNLIEAYDLIEFRGVLGYTMELVPGKDLGKVFASGPLSVADIEDVTKQVLSALAALHSHGIVHRDVKLENVIRREDKVVKLSDLGLMKMATQSNSTQAGVLLGTAQYLPPEYVKGGPFDNRGDLYAVGIMMFELFAGKRRYHGQKGMQILEDQLKTDFALPMTLLHGVQERFLRIIRKATAVDPKARYQTAEEMLSDFGVAADKRVDTTQSIRPQIKFRDFGRVEKAPSARVPKWLWIFLLSALISFWVAMLVRG